MPKTVPTPASATVEPSPRHLLRDDGEAGAQVAEWAMLAGVSAALCIALVALFTGGIFDAVVTALVRGLVRLIGSWF